MTWDEIPYGEACQRAVRILADGYGEAVVVRDGDQGRYWALYYFFWGQTPPATALPHWTEGPLPDTAQVRPPYEVKSWLAEMGFEEYLNDVD